MYTMLCFAPPLCSLDLTIHRLDCIAAPGNQQGDNPLLFREISPSRLPCSLFFMNPVYSGGRDKHRSASKLYGVCSDYAAVFSAIAIHYSLMEGRDIRITAWKKYMPVDIPFNQRPSADYRMSPARFPRDSRRTTCTSLNARSRMLPWRPTSATGLNSFWTGSGSPLMQQFPLVHI